MLFVTFSKLSTSIISIDCSRIPPIQDNICLFTWFIVSLHYTEILKVVKNEKKKKKKNDIFLIFAQSIDCRYKLEPPRIKLEPPRIGGSNEYPQSMFWSKNKKNRYTPVYTFSYKSRVQGGTHYTHLLS